MRDVGVLPMFPLGSVLLPGELLPLRVFEPRYRQLVVDLLADDVDPPEFGVTLIARGHEVGGGDQRSDVGTVARVVALDAVEGGQYAVVAVGVRRLRVNAWLPDDPYPLADVDDWPDGGPAEGPEREQLRLQVAASWSRVETTRRLAVEAGELPPPDDGHDLSLDDDPVMATYQLASLAPLGPADRYRLLAATTPNVRLDVLDRALDDVEAVLRFRSG